MRPAFKWGIISGISAGLWMLFMFILEQTGISSGSLGYFPAWALFITAIYLSILHTRENEFDGVIDFPRAFRAGLRCVAIASLIWNAIQFGYYQYLAQHPDILKKLYPLASEAEIQSYQVFTYQIQNAIVATGFTIVIGTVIALIFAMILRKAPEEEQPGQ